MTNEEKLANYEMMKNECFETRKLNDDLGKLVVVKNKKIAELEKENAELILGNKSLSEKLMNTTREKLDLQKENAELKDELKKWKDGIALKDEEIGCIETDFNTFKSEAKELLKGWLGDFYNPKAFYQQRAELVEQSEQFLKDSEVEK